MVTLHTNQITDVKIVCPGMWKGRASLWALGWQNLPKARHHAFDNETKKDDSRS